MKRLMSTILVVMLLSMVLAPAISASGIAAPTGLTGSAGENGITLSWNEVAGAGGYDIYRDNAYHDTVGGSPYTDDGATGSYTYSLAAFDESKANHSPRSNDVFVPEYPVQDDPAEEHPVEDDPVAPSAPKNLQRSFTGDRVELSWDASDGAAGYNVYRNNQYADTVLTNSWSGQAGNDSYYVTAFEETKQEFSGKSNVLPTTSSEGRGNFGDEEAEQADTSGQDNDPVQEDPVEEDSVQEDPVEEDGAPVTSLEAPQDLRVSSDSGDRAHHLRWSRVDGAAGYNVYHVLDGETSVETVRSVTNFSHQGAPGGEFYVTAFDESKTVFSSKSNIVTAPSAAPVDEAAAVLTLDAPVGLEFAPHPNFMPNFIFSWSPVADAVGYNVYEEGSDKPLATVFGTERIAIYTMGAKYSVVAFDISQTVFSERSATVTFNGTVDTSAQQDPVQQDPVQEDPVEAGDTPTDGNDIAESRVRPDAPQGVWVHQGFSDRNLVRWSPVQGAIGYNVYRDTEFQASVEGLEYSDPIRPNLHTYYVEAYDNQGAVSEKSVIVTGPPPPEESGTGTVNVGQVSAKFDGASGVLPEQRNTGDNGGLPNAAGVIDLDLIIIRDEDTDIPALVLDDSDDGPDPDLTNDQIQAMLRSGDGNDGTVKTGLTWGADIHGDAGDDNSSVLDSAVDTQSFDAALDDQASLDAAADLLGGTRLDKAGSGLVTTKSAIQIDPDANGDGIPDVDEIVDAYGGDQTFPENEDDPQKTDDGAYDGEQGGEPGEVPEDSPGLAPKQRSVTTDNGDQLSDAALDAVFDDSNADIATVVTDTGEGGYGFNGKVAKGSVGPSKTITETVVKDGDQTTATRQTDLTFGVDVGGGPVVVSGGVGASATNTHVVEVSGSSDVVQEDLEDGELTDASDVSRVVPGMTVTEIGEPGVQPLDLGYEVSGEAEVGATLSDLEDIGAGKKDKNKDKTDDQNKDGIDLDGGAKVTGSILRSSTDDDLKTTVISNDGQRIQVGTGESEITDVSYTVGGEAGATAERKEGANTTGVGKTFSGSVQVTNTTQKTNLTQVNYDAHDSDDLDRAQDQVDNRDPLLGADGLYDQTEIITNTHLETRSSLKGGESAKLNGGTTGQSDGEPVVVNLEVDQKTTTNHMKGQAGEEPVDDWWDGWSFSGRSTDVELGTSKNHTIDESMDDGLPGFTAGQRSEFSIPMSSTNTTVTASTENGITIEMTPAELQSNAKEALKTDPDNQILQDVADGMSLPEAIEKDATTGVELITIGHDNTKSLEAIEAIAQAEAKAEADAKAAADKAEADAKAAADKAKADAAAKERAAQQKRQNDSDSDQREREESAQRAETARQARAETNIDNDPYETAAYGTPTKEEKKDESSSNESSRVICTYFYKKGELDRADWVADLRFTQQEISAQAVRGYHAWGIPAVRVMKSGSRFGRAIEPFMRFIAQHRAAELSFQMGRRDKPDYAGKIVRRTMEPMCWMIGAVVPEQDWTELYDQNYQPVQITA